MMGGRRHDFIGCLLHSCRQQDQIANDTYLDLICINNVFMLQMSWQVLVLVTV